MLYPTDKELLSDMAGGNEQAFQQLFDRYWKRLFSFVYRLTKDENQTKDILQDVFLYIWNNREKLYTNDSFLPYLNAAARSQVMMGFRKDKVRLQGADILLDMLAEPVRSDEELLYKEVKQTVDLELEKMPFNMRRCFHLSRYEDRSIRDIAVELGLSEQTVKNYISEALRRLRISIEQGSLLYISLMVLKNIR